MIICLYCILRRAYNSNINCIIIVIIFREEDEGEDEVDSDFSIDENDEPVSDTEQEGQKKKRRLITKAYKEPKATTSHVQSTPKEKRIRQPRQNKVFIDSTGNTNKCK